MLAHVALQAQSYRNGKSAEMLARVPATGLDAVLRTVCRLAEAAGAHLLEIERWGGAVATIAHTEAEVSDGVAADLLSALPTDGEASLPLLHPLWDVQLEGGEARLIVRVSDRSSGGLFLILSFNETAAESRERLTRVVPDLAMLVRIAVNRESEARDLEQKLAAAVAALDDGECGMIGVRADHSVVFCNAAASTIVDKNDGLHVTRGILRPTQYGDVARFQAALDSVIQAASPTGSKRPRALVMMLDPDGKRRPKVVVITPMDHAGQAEWGAFPFQERYYFLVGLVTNFVPNSIK